MLVLLAAVGLRMMEKWKIRSFFAIFSSSKLDQLEGGREGSGWEDPPEIFQHCTTQEDPTMMVPV